MYLRDTFVAGWYLGLHGGHKTEDRSECHNRVQCGVHNCERGSSQ